MRQPKPEAYGILWSHASTAVEPDLVGRPYDTLQAAMDAAAPVLRAQPGVEHLIVCRRDGAWVTSHGVPVERVVAAVSDGASTLQAASARLGREAKKESRP